MDNEKWTYMGYDIPSIKKELENIQRVEEKLSFLLKAKIEKRVGFWHSNTSARDSTSELNSIIEYWKNEAEKIKKDKGQYMIDAIIKGKPKEQDKARFLFDKIKEIRLSLSVELTDKDIYQIVGNVLNKDWENIKQQINKTELRK